MAGFRTELLQNTVTDADFQVYRQLIPAVGPRHRYTVARVMIENLEAASKLIAVTIMDTMVAPGGGSTPDSFSMPLSPGDVTLTSLGFYTFTGPWVMTPGQLMAFFTRTNPGFTTDPRYHIDVVVEEIEEDAP